MNIGFIGLGGIAHNYFGHLARLPDVTIRAVCDVDRERVESVAKELGAAAYLDHRAMLEEERLDALFIAIPPYAHTDQVIHAAERRLPIFVAKPVALCLETAKPALEAIRRYRLLTNVGYMWRHADITDYAREKLDGRDIGLVIGQAHVGTPKTAWWRVFSQSGGQIVEQSTHLVDLARYFCGEVVEVHAWGGQRLNPDIDFEDVTTVNLRFEAGPIGNITSTSLVRTGLFGLELIGADFHLRFDYGRSRVIGHVGDESIDFTGEESGYARQIERFIRAVRDGETRLIRSDYADGVRTLAVTLAANESLHTGEVVTVPSVT